jgi:hypothetical protein
MQLDIALGVGLAGQAISFLQCAGSKFRFLLQCRFGNLTGHHLDLTAVTTSDTTTNTDQVHAQLAGTFEQVLITGELAAPANGFEVDGIQR